MKQGMALLLSAMAFVYVGCGNAAGDVARLTMASQGLLVSSSTMMDEAKKHAETTALTYVQTGYLPEACVPGASGGRSTVTCTFASETATCAGTTYTFSEGSLALSFLTTGTSINMDINITATVTGGDLSSSAVACDFDFDIDSTAGTATMGANVSCTVDGSSIGGGDLESALEGLSCS